MERELGINHPDQLPKEHNTQNQNQNPKNESVINREKISIIRNNILNNKKDNIPWPSIKGSIENSNKILDIQNRKELLSSIQKSKEGNNSKSYQNLSEENNAMNKNNQISNEKIKDIVKPNLIEKKPGNIRIEKLDKELKDWEEKLSHLESIEKLRKEELLKYTSELNNIENNSRTQEENIKKQEEEIQNLRNEINKIKANSQETQKFQNEFESSSKIVIKNKEPEPVNPDLENELNKCIDAIQRERDIKNEKEKLFIDIKTKAFSQKNFNQNNDQIIDNNYLLNQDKSQEILYNIKNKKNLISQIQNDIKDLQNTFSELQQKNIMLKSRLDSLKSLDQTNMVENNLLQKKFIEEEDKENVLNNINRKNHEQQKIIFEIEKQRESNKKDSEELANILAYKESTLNEQNNFIKTLKNSIDKLSTEIVNSIQDNEELKKQLDEKKKELEEEKLNKGVNNSNKDKRKKKSSIHPKIRALNMEIKKLGSDLVEKNQELAMIQEDHERIIGSLRVEILRLKTEYDQLTRNSPGGNSENVIAESKEKEILKLKKMLKAANAELENYKQKNSIDVYKILEDYNKEKEKKDILAKEQSEKAKSLFDLKLQWADEDNNFKAEIERLEKILINLKVEYAFEASKKEQLIANINNKKNNK